MICGNTGKIKLLAGITICGLWLTPVIHAEQQPAVSATQASSSTLQQDAQPWAASPFAQAIDAAWALFKSGQISKAENAFQQVVLDAAGSKDSSSVAEAHMGLGGIAFRHARFVAARTEYERALALFDVAHNLEGTARAHAGLGDAVSALGDTKTARNLFKQALTEFEAPGLEKERSQLLMRLGPVTDSYSERIKMATEALEIARKLGNRHLEGQALHWRGQWLFHEGDSEAAERDYKEAETLLDSPEDRTVLGRVFLSEGRLQRAHGALDQAIETFSRGLKLADETEDQDGRIALLNALGACYGDQKKHREALARFQQAFELAKETGSPRLVETLRQNIAEAYIELGEPRRGAEMLEEVNRQTPDPFPYQAQFRYATLALAYFRLQEYERAVAAASKSVAEARDRKNEQFLSEPLMLKAHAEEKLGQNDTALADVRDALKVIEGLRARLVPNDFLKRGFAEKTQEAFDYSVALLQEMNRPEQAIEVAEEARARAFLDLLASHQLALHRPAQPPVVPTEKAVAADKAVAQAGARGTTGSQANPGPNPLEQLPQRGGASARATHPSSREPELASAASAESASLKEMHQQAGRLHSTILSYWVSDEAAYVWVMNSEEGIHSARIAVKREHLADLVTDVLPSKENALSVNKSKAVEKELHLGGEVEFPTRGQVELKTSQSQKDRWRELYRLLIAPIETYLPSQEGSRITVIPHGPLFGLPFGGLRDAHGRYLLERYTLEYSPAISVLRFTGSIPARRTGSAPHFLLVGDPAGMQKLGLPQLPGSRREVSEVARWLTPNQVTVLTGEDARLEAVRSMAANSTIIHFATHGILDDKQPFDSFLALSDGKLTTRDIYGLNLSSDLVFLSACRSGMGKVSGDGVLGLTRAFLYAGTRSVVATLWDVADEPTSMLVARFYKNVSEGADRAQALRGAQLAVLRQLRTGKMKVTTPRGQLNLPENPVFWAGFVLIGEP